MSPDTELSARLIANAGSQDQLAPVGEPSTPPEIDAIPPSSQVTLPSTEGPASPIDPGQSFKTEINDDRIARAAIIRSSLTPPPSSQVPTNGGGAVGHPLGYVTSQRSGIFSPPPTGANISRREGVVSSEYAPPSPQQVVEAPPDELRSLLQACIAEHAKLKMETAHHKLQYNLLSLQADEDAKRAAVEHEMTRREVDALRDVENSRYARRELSTASESAQAKYLQLRIWYEESVEENESSNKRLKAAKKLIQQKEDEVISLTDERDMLLNRIRENREHFHLLCSPGGIFHTALTPKTQAAQSPAQYRATPRQTPKSAHREHGQEPFDVLLKAATQENNSAPSTPTNSYKPVPRTQSKHTRNVQSMSSLPTTPTPRSRGVHSGLLPSVDLVPQSEPPYRHNRYIPDTPTSARHQQRRKSRESTISAEDNEELARQALSSFASRGSQNSRGSRRRQPAEEEEEDVFESQASQAASEMLRRDPRESFEVAGSATGSRDGTPAPAATERSAKLQAKLFAGLNKSGVSASDKRKFSGHESRDDVARREVLTNPTKKLRMAGGLRDPNRVGLGIQYSQET